MTAVKGWAEKAITARKSLFQPHRFIIAHRPGLEGVQRLRCVCPAKS